MKKIIFGLVLSLFFFSSASAAEFNKNLRFGSKGAEVTKLQEFLTEQGIYSGPITGNFFSLTLKAVKSFQSANNISPVSGYFGPLTRVKANEVLDSQLADQNAEAADEPVIEPKTTDDVVSKLNEQLALQQNQNQLLQQQLQNQQGALDQIVMNTTPPPAPEPVVAPPTPLLKPYELWQMGDKKLTAYSHYKGLEFSKTSSDARQHIINVTFNDQPLNFNGSNNVIIPDLIPDQSYSYSWTYREDGREDSVFTGTVAPYGFEKTLFCSWQYGRNPLKLPIQVVSYDSTLTLDLNCDTEIPNSEIKSFDVSIYSLNELGNSGVVDYVVNNQSVFSKNLTIQPNGVKQTYTIPNQLNGKLQFIFNAPTAFSRLVAEINKVTFTDESGVERIVKSN